MSKRIEITENQLQDIKALVEYLENDDEENNYEQWKEDACPELGDSHIWQSVVAVRTMLNKIENV